MAKVTQRRAAKDYPDQGIHKGQLYWFANVKTGPRSSHVIRSLERPRPSQLTSSDFKQQWYGAQETLEDNDSPTADDIREIGSEIESLMDETQERLDNMPDGLREGSTGEMLSNRVDACEVAKDALEDVADRMESLESEEDDGDEENDGETSEGSTGDDEETESMDDLITEARGILPENEPD